MSSNSIARATSWLVLPVLFALFIAVRTSPEGRGIDISWFTLAFIGAMIVVERLLKYDRAVSQRHVVARDILSTLVNLYVTGGFAALILVPLLGFFPEYFLGRRLVVSSPSQLGPFWFQVILVPLVISLFRYWMHRLQHSVPFLWQLHSYHHRVTDLRASNLLVSHPIDFVLRNILVFVVLGLIGFYPLAILIGATPLHVSGYFSHCGGNVRGGLLNYVFATPEVHRWHHSAKVPDGHKYSVNYGVELSIWDLAFGTFHLPMKNGQPDQPERLGHPDGLPDESNYLKLLLAPLGLWRAFPRFKRATDTARS